MTGPFTEPSHIIDICKHIVINYLKKQWNEQEKLMIYGFFNQIILVRCPSFMRPISKQNDIDQREITQYLNRTFNVYLSVDTVL